ncbi:tetratricopeptide repeat protein [Amnibacterium setariae]|uniref:Co-chaperone YbbN n=1 Tax=Amnibacterium setariae TaxID=2306585 RepID=A0A3A1U3B6_9MICO|nr:tetratricopeptide repeat protein [Amnibacterium setariae]RIX28337.1 co-chaperone YbbN [Amnibacterium setariae]
MAAVPAPPPGGLRGAIDLSPLVARQNQQAAQSARGPAPDGQQAPPSDVVVEVGDAEFPQLVELSRTVPVVVALVATWSTPSQDLAVSLRRVVESAAGRLLLAIVDADASPQIAQAFQAQSIPTVVAVVAGSPVPLFAGVLPEERMGPLFDQVLELAAQNGVTGTVPGVAGADQEGAPAAEPEPEPLPPLHQEAYAAIDRQDYAEAARLFRTAIAQDPRDAAAPAALAQVELLDRLRTVPAEARTAAADDPKDVAAALAVADLDVAGGHVEDAFDRLLDAFATASGDDRTAIRTRLLDYFNLTGTDDPRVVAARRRLATLLY